MYVQGGMVITIDRVLLDTLWQGLEMRFGISIDYFWQHLSSIQTKWTGPRMAGSRCAECVFGAAMRGTVVRQFVLTYSAESLLLGLCGSLCHRKRCAIIAAIEKTLISIF
jgi:hypothetical protein